MAEFNIGERVADHGAGFCPDLRKLRYRLFEEAGQRFAAVALLLVVRAKVKAVHVCIVRLQEVLQP